MERPETVGELTEILRQGGYLADRGLATALFVALSLQRPILLEGEVGVGKTEVAKVLAAVFGRKLIRLQCYEGIDTNQALYEWDYARQMLHIRALSERQIADGDAVDKLFGPQVPAGAAAAGGGPGRRPGGAADRRGGPRRRRVRGLPARTALRLPDHHPRDRHDQGGEPAARGAHLQPHPRTARRAEAALPVPLDRLPARRARGGDRAGPRARRVRGADPQGRRRGQPAARAGPGQAARGGRDHRLGAHARLPGRDAISTRRPPRTRSAPWSRNATTSTLVRDNLEEITSGA